MTLFPRTEAMRGIGAKQNVRCIDCMRKNYNATMILPRFKWRRFWCPIDADFHLLDDGYPLVTFKR
jgi:hypothetical protein